jgi:hypothetical protein
MNDRQARRTAKGQAGDGLPLENYDSLSADEIAEKLVELTPKEVEELCRHEMANKNRRNLLRYFENRIGAAAATSVAGREDPPPGEERPEKRKEAMARPFAREEPPPGEERPERRVP